MIGDGHPGTSKEFFLFSLLVILICLIIKYILGL